MDARKFVALGFVLASCRAFLPNTRTSGHSSWFTSPNRRAHDEIDAPFESTEGRVTRIERRGDTLAGLSQEEGAPVSADDLTDDPADDPLMPLIETITRAADKRKAEGIRAMRVSHITITTEFFVNMVGNSRPQNQAIAAAIVEDVEEQHGRTCRNEGTADSGWILLDFGDVIVNVMTPRSREYYDIETFWSEGQDVDVSNWLMPTFAPSGGVAPSAVSPAAADPFWDTEGDGDDWNAATAWAAKDGNEEKGAFTDEEDDPFWALGDDENEASNGPEPSSGKGPAPDEEDPFWS